MHFIKWKNALHYSWSCSKSYFLNWQLNSRKILVQIGLILNYRWTNQAWLVYIILAFSELLNSRKPPSVLNQIVIPPGKGAGVPRHSKISHRTVSNSASHSYHPLSSFQLSLPHSPFMGKPFLWLLGDWTQSLTLIAGDAPGTHLS